MKRKTTTLLGIVLVLGLSACGTTPTVTKEINAKKITLNNEINIEDLYQKGLLAAMANDFENTEKWFRLAAERETY